MLVSQSAINQGLRLFAAFVCGFATSNLYNRLDWRLPVELYALALLVVYFLRSFMSSRGTLECLATAFASQMA